MNPTPEQRATDCTKHLPLASAAHVLQRAAEEGKCKRMTQCDHCGGWYVEDK